MKKLFCIIIVCISSLAYSQLYVSANSYVYNKGTVVFVNQGIELNKNLVTPINGNIYLREEGQLVQGLATTSSTNKGDGVVSVFQEGTSDNFDYNYWCSPVGIASASVGNDNFGITMLNRPTSVTASTPATMLAMNSYDGVANPLQIAPNWINKFLSNAAYSGWIKVGSSSTLLPGEGFTMKGTSGADATDIEGNGVQNNPGGAGAQRYDFRGKPNDGDITVYVDSNKFTLTGNPYPSALHVNAFLLDPANTNCTGIAYYWEQNKTTNSHTLAQYQGGYGKYSPISLASNGVYLPATFNVYNGDGTVNTTGVSSGLVIERKYAPIGQGFMVKGIASVLPTPNNFVTLKNTQREYYKEAGALSQFERLNQSKNDVSNVAVSNQNGLQPVSLIRLNTTFNNQFTKQLALAFVSEATDGVDRGIDALGTTSINLPNDVYFFLDNSRYEIQGINFDINKRIPLGVKATDNATFKFKVATIEYFDANQNIFLFDGLDGSYHDIKNQEYEVILPTGITTNRFEITFINPTSNLNTNTTAKNNFVIFENNANQLLNISNPMMLDVKSLSLYDLTGKQIFSKLNLGVQESYQFSTSGLPASVYLVEMYSNDNRKEVQKIVVSNTKN